MTDQKKKLDDKELEKITGGSGKATGGAGHEAERESTGDGQYQQST